MRRGEVREKSCPYANLLISEFEFEFEADPNFNLYLWIMTYIYICSHIVSR